MKDKLRATVWRLAVFLTVCVVGAFALLAIFAQLRFGDGTRYSANFTNVTGLKKGDFVRIAGVEIGKVEALNINPDQTVRVQFSASDAAQLTEGTRAVIRYDNVIGGRFVALEEGPGGLSRLAPGEAIPVSRTAPALDLDSVIGGFKPLFQALNPEQVNDLSGQLEAALGGQGPTIGSFLNQAAALTNTLADRDQLISEVVTNLDSVLGTLGDQSGQLDKAVTNLSQLVEGLNARKTDISNAFADTNAAAATVADLLVQARPPLQKVVHETNRVATIAITDHEYLDTIINTLPDKYKALSRQGMYGDYFSFYLCDLVLKLNGKGGQPVYVKVAAQDTGRCTPK
jgi:phospholipid/cholesterol/gamma-HCH transport system substrate-binding protein